MLIARLIAALSFGGVGLLLCLAFVVEVCGGSALVGHSIENNQTIEREFSRAASLVEQFRTTHSRLPTPVEFSSALHQSRYQVAIEYPPYSEEVLRRFGPPAGDPYLLTVWRGEWIEYYASWRKLSSITQSRADYYLLGSPWAERALIGVGAFLFLAGAWRAWPARSPKVRPN